MAEDLVEKVRYEADISDIQSKLRTLADKQDTLATDTERHTGRMKKTWTGFKDLVSSGAVWFAGIAATSAIIIPKLLDSGASLEALDKKARTVFSDGSLAQVQAWAKGVAGSMGLTDSQAVAMAASMADLFKPMGFTADQAAKLSTNLGDMSGALSAWSGGKRSAAEVSEILTKAMLGERDGLVDLGIKISEADVQARLAANGTKDLTGAALEQAKAMATMELIQEKSTDAQKAWTDGSMDAIKKQNEGKASMKQLGEVITKIVYPILQKLVPILTTVAEWIGEKLPGALDTVGKIFSSVFEGGKRLISDLADTFGTSGKTIGLVLGGIVVALIGVALAWNAGPGLIVTAVVAFIGAFLWAYENVAWFRDGVQGALAVVKAVIDGVIETGQWLADKFQMLWDKSEPLRAFFVGAFSLAFTAVKTQFDIVKDAVGFVVEILQTLWDKAEPLRAFLVGAFSLGLSAVKLAFDVIKDSVGWLIDKLTALWSKLETVIKKAKEAYDWVVAVFTGADMNGSVGAGAFPTTPGAGSIPVSRPFHNGGIVGGFPGEEVFARLRPGERVQTVGQQASSGGGQSIGTVNVYTDLPPRRFFDEALWRVA